MINSTSRFANLFRNVLKKQGVTVDRIVFDKCSGGFVIPSLPELNQFTTWTHFLDSPDDWTTVYTHFSKHPAVLMDRCLQIR